MHKNLEACSGSSTTSMYFDLFLELHLNPQGTPKQHIFDIKTLSLRTDNCKA